MRCKLSDLSDFAIESVSFTEASVENYVSTESMIADRGGITEPSALPRSGSIRKYRPGDVLISNIRPYFKKIWRATRTGTCSNDVLVIRSNGSCNPAYLYYVLSSDDFFNYMTATSKGTKMPRGDKVALMDYEIDLPSMEQQEQFTFTMSKIDDLIRVNSKINDYLDKLLRSQFEKTIETTVSSVTLSKIADVQTGPFGSQLHQSDYVKEGTPLISVENIGNICIDTNKMSYVSEEDTKRLSRYTMKTGDIIFSRVGYVDRSSFVSEYENGWIYSGSCLRIRSIEAVVSPLFLYYYLNQPCEKDYLKAIAVGATRPSLNTSILSEHKIDLPSTESMVHFDNIATSVQKAISNNKRQNEILKDLRNNLIKKMLQDYDK